MYSMTPTAEVGADAEEVTETECPAPLALAAVSRYHEAVTHTLILLSYVILGWGLAAAALRLAPRFGRWGDRRAIHQLALFSPLLALALSGGWSAQMALTGCLMFTTADGVGTLLLMALLAGLLLTGSARETWRIFATRRRLEAIAEPAEALPISLSGIASKLGVHPPTLRLLPLERPFAAVAGVRRPVLFLSRWMLALPTVQLEAVVAHELAHLRHHDNMIAWLDVVLLRTFGFLPPMHTAWEESLAEREEAADAQAASATGDPVSLAAALVAVAEAGAAPVPAGATPFHAAGAMLERRVERLLEAQLSGRPWGAPALAAGAVALVLPLLTSWSLGYWTSCLVH